MSLTTRGEKANVTLKMRIELRSREVESVDASALRSLVQHVAEEQLKSCEYEKVGDESVDCLKRVEICCAAGV